MVHGVLTYETVTGAKEQIRIGIQEPMERVKSITINSYRHGWRKY
jgi:hypothetical protein